MLIIYEIEPKNDFLISKYCPFARNCDSLAKRDKNDFMDKKNFFKMILKYRRFLQNVDSLGDGTNKRFFVRKSLF